MYGGNDADKHQRLLLSFQFFLSDKKDLSELTNRIYNQSKLKKNLYVEKFKSSLPDKYGMKKCLYCAELSRADAVICRYCHYDLSKTYYYEENKFGCGNVILALLIPILGIIIGIVWLTSEENRERAWPMIGVSLLGIFLWWIIVIIF